MAPNDFAEQYERLGVFPTMDTGVRLSDAELWDESERPTRTAAFSWSCRAIL